MNKRQIKKTKRKNIQEIEKELRKKTLDELKMLLSQTLYDEFKDDPEYQRRFSQ